MKMLLSYYFFEVLFFAFSTSGQTPQSASTARTTHPIIIYKNLTEITSFLTCSIPSNLRWFLSLVFYTRSITMGHKAISIFEFTDFIKPLLFVSYVIMPLTSIQSLFGFANSFTRSVAVTIPTT